MPVTTVEGLHNGDEGKGGTINKLSQNADIVVGFSGGTNAGHTTVREDGEMFKLHVMPSGILHPDVVNVVGNGKYIHAEKLNTEIDDLLERNVVVTPRNFKVSSAAHFILPQHVSADEIEEKRITAQGTTQSGIRFVASDKVKRVGFRAGIPDISLGELEEKIISELLAQQAERDELELPKLDEAEVAEEYVQAVRRIGLYVTDTAMYLNEQLEQGKRVLAEGAQGFLLDIDHGLYPHTSSGSTGSGGVSMGTGIPPTYIDRIIGVIKTTQSKVGGGPFLTKILDPELADLIHGPDDAPDGEFGTTTGRKRDLGFLDLAAARRAIRISGIQEIVLTKLDWVNRFGSEIPICVGYERGGRREEYAPDTLEKYMASTPIYETLPGWDDGLGDIKNFNDLPPNARKYIEFLEMQLKRPITMFGVGQREDQLIVR